MAKKVTILSIDGGGIRGIIPGVIIDYLETEIRKIEGDNKRISDYFDLMAGTSTGGILTGLYLLPGNENGEIKAKYTAQEAVNLYFLNGPKIFDLKLWQKIESLGGLADEKYDADEFDKALSSYFGDARLSQLLAPCLITAYDIERRKTVFFTSATAVGTPSRDYIMRDVVRATSSAPTYFQPPRIKSMDGTEHALIDGGIFANNPALCAYAEARKMNFRSVGKAEQPYVEDMLMISIGTGSKSMAARKPYYYSTYKNAGKIKWIAPIIDMMMSGNSETVDFQLQQIFDTMPEEHQKDYHRLEPGVGNATADMDDARQKNMEALRESAQSFISENKEELDLIVRKLIAHNTEKPESIA